MATSPDVDLSGVACPSVTVCVVIGVYTDSSGNEQGLLLTRHGPSWTASKAPLPPGARPGPGLYRVACPSVTVCVATGVYTDSSGNTQGLLLTRHQSTWTAAKAPVPAGTFTSSSVNLSGLACPSATRCAVAGSATGRAPADGQVMILTGPGPSWTAARAPFPAGAVINHEVEMSGVACPSVTVCTATGGYTDSSGTVQAMLLTGHGSSWTAARAPVPAGADPSPEPNLWGVACPSVTICLAAGTYRDSPGSEQVMLLTGHQSMWTAAQAPLPSGAATRPGLDPGPPLYISGLVCPSAAVCVAVGSYTDSSRNAQGLLVTGPP
jgi:hypothetical protein